METPSINANLDRQCYCDRLGIGADPHHVATCPARPLHIPCPIPPSVTFHVTLGECACGEAEVLAECDLGCPARPISVSCSILGKTWEESYPVTFEHGDGGGPDAAIPGLVASRWALVKALVLGKPQPDVMEMVGRWHISDLFKQRDAVFAALCKMAQAEDAALVAQQAVDEAFPFQRFCLSPTADHRREPHPSRERLRAYVSHLIEQVGVLGT